jgi:predicted transcriptional regulator
MGAVTDDPVDAGKRTTLLGIAALGAASSVPSIASGEGGGSDTRRSITAYVARVPGAHFSKVRDDCGLATGETQHHLRTLESKDVLESDRDGDYRRFFLADRFSTFERTALGYLRRETARGILIELLATPETTATAIAETLSVSRPAVSTQAALLEEAGLLDRSEGYRIRRPETVLTLVVRYADSFGPRAIELAHRADELVAYDP